MNQRRAWTRVLIEGVVIIASILLAFGIDAWWEGRDEARREQRHLAALFAEFEQNAALLQEAREYYEARYMDALRLLEAVDGSVLEADDPKLESALGGLLASRSFHLESGAHDALLNSGELDLIRDERLRNRLAAWPSYVVEWAEEQEAVFTYVGETIAPFLRSTVRIRAMRGAFPDFPDGDAPPPIPLGKRIQGPMMQLTGPVAFDNLVYQRSQGL